MNLLQLLNNVEYFVAHWAGTTVPRVLMAFIGILVCLWIAMAIWEKRVRMLGAVAGMALALFLILMAIDPGILRYLAGTSFLARIRIMMVVLSFLVTVITIEAIRRTHLQERYAILWVTTGLIILITAFFPHILDLFSFLLGTQYVTSVVGIVFTFLLLISFHFSIALSGIQKKQAQIARRCAILEAKIEELSNQVAAFSSLREVHNNVAEEGCHSDSPLTVSSLKESREVKPVVVKKFADPYRMSLVVIGLSFFAVLITGLLTPQAMIGDEVTHYYMLVEQSRTLPKPNFHAYIPTAWGGDEIRLYPHSCLWHYLGAVAYRLTGGSFYAVQVYHALLWLQFLWVALLLAREYGRKDSYLPILYILVLASLPLSLIFSVAFYQDIPMAAQVLTAFYLLRKRKWFWASIFMALAIAMKVSALLFVPIFLFFMLLWEQRAGSWRHSVTTLLVAILILGFSSWGVGWALWKYAGSRYYPVEQFQKIIYVIQDKFGNLGKGSHPAKTSKDDQRKDSKTSLSASTESAAQRMKTISAYEAKIIANHPGDLRIPENFLIYGGGILWLVILVGGFSLFYALYGRQKSKTDFEFNWWPLAVGVWYLGISAYFLRSAPDARFFLPGVAFVLLPLVEGVTRLPKPKIVIAVVAAMAVLQGSQVLKKTYDLRNISVGLREAITYLQKNSVSPPKIFMYPEGNYRLFPYVHDWYLEYRLREFWKGNNSTRIDMLRNNRIGAIVVKKHLIAEVDDAITNLGVYPTYFFRDLEKDKQFQKLFENRDVVIFKVP